MPAPILDPGSLRAVRSGFAELLPAGQEVEPHLRGVIADTLAHPGGLVRAQLAYGLMRDHCVDLAPARALAVGLEYFHTASLLFDDLPAMDDARERRSHPCPHRRYGEGATILGALALVNRAYTLLWQVLGELPAAERRQATALVDQCLGVTGILDGQSRDLHYGPSSDGEPFGAVEEAGDSVVRVAEGKTVTLIRLTLLLPALVAGVSAAERRALDRLARDWGLAYQLLDDVKDVVSTGAAAGKTTQRDGTLGRPNLLAGVGKRAARARLTALLDRAQERIQAVASGPRGAAWAALDKVQSLLETEQKRLCELLDPSLAQPLEIQPLETQPFEAQQAKTRQDVSRPVVQRPVVEQPHHFAERMLARTMGAADTIVVTLEAPLAPAEAFLDLARQLPSCFWDPGHGAAWAGVGAAHELSAQGDDRFAQLRAAAERLAPRIATVAQPGVPAPAPRFFGGTAFDAGSADQTPWDEFGDASFVLPRLTYRTRSDRADLTLAVRGDELGNRKLRARWLDKLVRALDALAEPAGETAIDERCASPRGVEVLEPPSLAEWSALVDAIGRGIADGQFTKIVAARRSRVAVLAPLTVTDVLRRLTSPTSDPSPTDSRSAGVTRFVFGRSRSAFVGATPERLIAYDGERFCTEALAGSARRGDAESLRALSGAKIEREHQIVVDEITRRLTPLSASLSIAPAPELRVLRDIVHVRTAILGRLATRRHVLDLADVLHPTPAVGGVPCRGALAWIAAQERMPRGWYAAPVGWFDTVGCGELAVALRCCVLRGAEAHLYAGAGIVAGSDPLEEFHEAALKERTLLRALGG